MDPISVAMLGILGMFALIALQIPIGIIGVPLGIVLLPSLSREAALGAGEGFTRLVSRGLALLGYVMVAIAALGIVVSEDIVRLLFGVARGVVLVAIALVIYNQLMGGDGGIQMIDDSRSRTMFADIQQQLAALLPEDGPQWIAGYYERLTQNCVATESAMAVTLPRAPSI